MSTNAKGIIHALCTSKVKGIAKEPVDEISLIIDHGIEGDAHAGKWHRQVSLLSLTSVNYMKDRGAPVDKGSFGENIIVDGIEVDLLPVGTYLKAGNNVILRVTQIGKECHEMCAIGQAVGECIMPKKGIFCEVIKEGKLHPGESIKVIDEPICKIKDILSREQQAIAAHVEKFIGTVSTVYTPEDSQEPVISILEVAPSKGRDGWTYITCGASLKEQDLPYKTPDWIIPRTEYLCYVKDKTSWPVDVLNLLGRLPFEKKTHLFWWHTVNYLSPLDEDNETTQSALLLLPPYFEDEDFDNFTLYGDDVRFLMALPITEEERSFAAEYGGQKLEEKLLSANSDFIFDPKRESVI